MAQYRVFPPEDKFRGRLPGSPCQLPRRSRSVNLKPRLTLISCFVLLVLDGSLALARPPHKRALADYFGPFLAKKLNDCRTCHLPDRPGAKPEEGEKPHNAFGARLAAVRAELRRAGKKADLAARLDAIAEEDSDGDGAPNLLELLAGRAPGDPSDTPTP